MSHCPGGDFMSFYFSLCLLRANIFITFSCSCTQKPQTLNPMQELLAHLPGKKKVALVRTWVFFTTPTPTRWLRYIRSSFMVIDEAIRCMDGSNIPRFHIRCLPTVEALDHPPWATTLWLLPPLLLCSPWKDGRRLAACMRRMSGIIYPSKST